MKCSVSAIVSAAALLCLGGTPAWASPLPTADVNWSYNFTPNQGSVLSDSGNGAVTFTNEQTRSATNSSDVVVTNLRTSSVASAGNPDTLMNNGAWTVGLKLTDSASGATDTMMFSGKLGGSFSKANANVTNSFTGTQSYTWTAPNGNSYTVSLIGYTPPGPPNANNAGSISAFVSVNGGGHGSGSTPEPSSLVLSCLGLGFAGLTTWRKRRRSLASMLA